MDLPQLGVTNVLLGILAGVAAAQMMALFVAVIWLKRTAVQVSQAATRFESRLAPLVGEAGQLIAGLHATVHQAGALVNAIDLRTRRAIATVDAVNEAVGALVNTPWSQVLRALGPGLRRGLRASVRPESHDRI